MVSDGGFCTFSHPFNEPNQKLCPSTKPGAGVPDESSAENLTILLNHKIYLEFLPQ